MSRDAAPALDLSPPRAWRQFVPSWLRSLIWVDSALNYDAFLSYSWKSDRNVAPVIQSVIQRFLCPWYKLRAKTVFRDLSCLPAGSSLETELFARLDRSKHLIVLASGNAATSRGMEIEAQHWFSRPRDGEVLIIVCSSDCENWDEIRNQVLPQAIKANLISEPLWVSLQHQRDRILANPSDDRLREELIEDLKQILLRFYPARDWGQLRGEERSQRRRALGFLSVFSMLLLALTAYSWFARHEAVQQRQVAERRRQTAISRQLAAQAMASTNGQLDLALLLSVESYRHEGTAEAYQALLGSLEHERRLLGFTWLREKPLSNIALDATGSALLLVQDDRGRAVMWNVSAGRQMCQLPSTLDNVDYRVTLSSDGKIFALDEAEGTVSIWDVGTCEPLPIPRLACGPGVRTVVLSHNGHLLATVGESGVLKVWNLSGRKLQTQVVGGRSELKEITAVAFSPDDSVVAFAIGPPAGDTVTLEGGVEVRLLNLEKGTSIRVTGETGIVHALAFAPTGTVLASGGCGENPTEVFTCINGEIVLWQLDKKFKSYHLPNVSGEVYNLAFTPGTSKLISAGCSGLVGDDPSTCKGDISLWNLEGDISVYVHEMNHVTLSEVRPFPSIAMSPNGGKFVSLDNNNVVQRWLIDDENPLIESIPTAAQRRTPELSTQLRCQETSTVSSIGHVSVKCTKTGAELENPTTHQSARITLENPHLPLERVAISEDNRTLVSIAGGAEQASSELRLWDVETGRQLGPPLVGNTREVVAAAFNKNGTVLAAGGCGEYNVFSGCHGELVLWHVPSGTLLAPPFTTDGNVEDFDFDGERLVVKIKILGLEEPTMARLDLDAASWTRRACARANRNLSADEWHRYLPDEPYRETCVFDRLAAVETH